MIKRMHSIALITASLILTMPAEAAGFFNCSNEQQAFTEPAVSEALQLAVGAIDNLKNTPLPNPTYSEWFGSSTPERQKLIESHYLALKSHLLIGVLTLDCNCTAKAESNNVRAYAIFKNPYEIHLCSSFFETHVSPTDGFSTRGGVILHEVSHFEIVNDTRDDVNNGVKAARERAKNSAEKAIINADNHHFFAEAVAGAK